MRFRQTSIATSRRISTPISSNSNPLDFACLYAAIKSPPSPHAGSGTPDVVIIIGRWNRFSMPLIGAHPHTLTESRDSAVADSAVRNAQHSASNNFCQLILFPFTLLTLGRPRGCGVLWLCEGVGVQRVLNVWHTLFRIIPSSPVGSVKGCFSNSIL